MKFFFQSLFFIFLFCLTVTSCSDTKKPIKSKTDIKVDSLLKLMSLEEKVGQMTQLTLNKVFRTKEITEHTVIPKKNLENSIVKYNIGSVLNSVNHALEAGAWRNVITQLQNATKKTPHNIPVLYGIDAIHGAGYTLNATLFPHNIGMAATRNDALVKQAAQITAKEVRASGIRWNFDPVLDVGRQQLWSRFPETFGEDVTLVTNMGIETIKGYEGDDLKSVNSVASCMKHFVGYSAPKSGKDRTPAYLSDIELWEYYLPQFKAAVNAGAATIMINSGTLNGVPGHANEYLLKTVLRDQFKFKGVAVSDWEDIIRLHTKHKIAKTPKEAVKIAVNAGIDMSMVPSNYSFYHLLIELVNAGEVSMQRIDEAVGRILKLKFDLGLFDNPYPEKEAIDLFGQESYKNAALEAARESVTLLKNTDHILPLSKNKKVLVMGPGANSHACLNGCWSYTWQGQREDLYPEQEVTIVQAIQEKIGTKNVIDGSFSDFKNPKNFKTDLINKNAKNADYIVLCLGENAYAESPGSIDDLTLDANQIELAKAAIETGKPVILVMTEGRPRIVSSFVDNIAGVLQAYWPGSQGANAIADVLFGDYNPNGILPYTYPRATGDLLTYDHKFSETHKDLKGNKPAVFYPQWEFGFGLSYTTFSFGEIQVSSKEIQGNETIKISISVTNSGKRDGKKAIELYSKDEYASIAPSVKRLRKYKKIALKAGETKTVTFQLNAKDMSFVNQQLQRVTEPGNFRLIIGNKQTVINYVK
ncbi:beta-glucosidase [Wenyingzhuangia heitensis]|uniref:beta-glucosidase n=1 Tax=Wenyingzhuangia heitensis TaxID=1487859 RepID=A0ABX0U891_9FLAO|nr:glycoside hydrolase family 3 N-terminal domain-containing protein [Wenyingzhuangia heitensis]NIJ43836.1 beta-glucosidase [Wenyingzhuangia heitensis]